MNLYAVIAAIAFVSYLLGAKAGREARDRSLLIGPDGQGVTGAHLIAGGFYYIVPEHTYSQLTLTDLRLRQLIEGPDEQDEDQAEEA